MIPFFVGLVACFGAFFGFENRLRAVAKVGALRRSAQMSAAARRTHIAQSGSLFSCTLVPSPGMGDCSHYRGTNDRVMGHWRETRVFCRSQTQFGQRPFETTREK